MQQPLKMASAWPDPLSHLHRPEYGEDRGHSSPISMAFFRLQRNSESQKEKCSDTL